MIHTIKTLKTKDIVSNKGQIEGLPANPRLIKNDKYTKLVQSIKDFPDMINLREIIAIEYEGKYITLCGNMRLRAIKENGIDQVPVKVLDKDTSLDKILELVIKDNISFGDHNYDSLANEWDQVLLSDWGVEVPDFSSPEEPEKEKTKTQKFTLQFTNEEVMLTAIRILEDNAVDFLIK